jgi:hypothetical protein
MTKIYTLTKQINEILKQINTKYDLDIEIKSDNYIFNNNIIRNHIGLENPYCCLIEAPQIRQILVDLKDVLGENPRIKKGLFEYDGAYHYVNNAFFAEIVHNNNGFDYIDELNFADLSSDLCHKWLDGLTPMIDGEPERVLKELIELLKNLTK